MAVKVMRAYACVYSRRVCGREALAHAAAEQGLGGQVAAGAVEVLSRAAQDFAVEAMEDLVRFARHRGNADLRGMLSDGVELGNEEMVVLWGKEFDGYGRAVRPA
jgi:hypothetical protein